jgi:hypothetical protein
LILVGNASFIGQLGTKDFAGWGSGLAGGSCRRFRAVAVLAFGFTEALRQTIVLILVIFIVGF